jgi:hypothetical protein
MRTDPLRNEFYTRAKLQTLASIVLVALPAIRGRMTISSAARTNIKCSGEPVPQRRQ